MVERAFQRALTVAHGRGATLGQAGNFQIIAVAGPGIHADLLATTTRRDGPVQVTYAGWPLYTWPPDRQPGQATGQALANGGGRWWVLGPDGRPITTPRA